MIVYRKRTKLSSRTLVYKSAMMRGDLEQQQPTPLESSHIVQETNFRCALRWYIQAACISTRGYTNFQGWLVLRSQKRDEVNSVLSPCFHPLVPLIYRRGHATTGTLASHAVRWREEHEGTEVSLALITFARLTIKQGALRAGTFLCVVAPEERVRLRRGTEDGSWCTFNLRAHE